MKLTAIFLYLGVAPFMVSCALQPVVLSPVGPSPYGIGASSSKQGDLVVYTETEEYYEDQMPYFPHSDYMIYTKEGKLLRRVWNHQNHEDESPTIVTLPPGEYLVKAWAEFYGLTSVPVIIQPNRTTRVILQPGWNPGTTVANSDLVKIPNGYFVGWRGQTQPGQ